MASLDRGVKVSPALGPVFAILVDSFHFPKTISSAVWDITERLFFAASPDGSTYQANLFRQRTDER
ncbi:hypothetical protein AZE42_09208 [Rhizopogon vesiculosus]|uniref:Uncharacterized protein n=1 Tax=Rhizopogon vesiculosus TaxID=180088 RepID=A0A1J8QMZ4_9AGAM|nr:hypothetical protein AZE42_09208 [Rhizopogon vesiculosus]